MKKTILIVIILFIISFIACEDKKQLQPNNIITIITPNFDNKITKPIRKEAEKFEKENNVKILILAPSWEDMVSKIKESLNDKNITYDIFVIFSSWAGSLLSKDHAQEIPKWVKDKIEWDDVLSIYKENVLSWNNKYYFLPYDGDNLTIFYRKDLFENKKNQENFKKRFGYKLEAPKTWKQYNDIANFFTAWDWDNDGKIEYGLAESRLKGYGTLMQFFTKAAAYTKHPDINTYYFDNYMNPNINNEGFIYALEEFIKIMQYAPPTLINYSPAEVRQSFISGEVALALDWADTGTMVENAKESLVKGKVAYAKLPGANRVFNSEQNKWEKIYNAPSSISGNWIMVINKNSKNKYLAFDFASHMTSKEITTKLISKGTSGINPSRYSHLDLNNLQQWEKDGFSKQATIDYLKTINESLNNKNVLTDMRIPGSDLYYEVLDLNINKAIKKEISAKEALDLTAKQWNIITKNIGLEKQIISYRKSINE